MSDSVIYIIHPSMTEAMKKEFGGALPSNVIVMERLLKTKPAGARSFIRPANKKYINRSTTSE